MVHQPVTSRTAHPVLNFAKTVSTKERLLCPASRGSDITSRRTPVIKKNTYPFTGMCGVPALVSTPCELAFYRKKQEHHLKSATIISLCKEDLQISTGKIQNAEQSHFPTEPPHMNRPNLPLSQFNKKLANCPILHCLDFCRTLKT